MKLTSMSRTPPQLILNKSIFVCLCCKINVSHKVDAMMRKICFLLFVLFSMQGFAQTGIGTSTPHASAKLEVASTTMGFLPPRMTSAQRLAISNPAEGLMVYQTDGTSGLYYRGATDWFYIINSSNNVLPVLNGGTGTTTSTGTGSVVLSTSPTLVSPTLGNATGTSLSLSSTTASTSTTTGALTVSGGVGVGGDVRAANFIGGEIPIYLSANKASSQSIPFNTETIITNWDGAGWINNFPSAWNSTSGVWTCPRAGIYEFYFTASLDPHPGSGIGNEFAVILSLNGALQSVGDFWAQTTSTTRAPHVSTNLIMSLNEGDKVTARIYQNLNGAAINTIAGRLYFQIKQLPSRINRQ